MTFCTGCPSSRSELVSRGSVASLSVCASLAAAKEDRRAEERTVAPKRVAPVGPSAGGRQPAPRNLLPKKSPPFANAAAAKVAIKKSPSGFKGPGPKRPWLSTTPSSGAPPAKQAALAPGAAASKKLPSSATLVGAVRKPGTVSVPLASQAPGRLGTSNPALSQPNSQIRQNIRRSLKEILWKRWVLLLEFSLLEQRGAVTW